MGKRKAAPKALPSYSLSGREAGEVVLYVGNLPTTVDWKVLKDLFAPFGALFSDIKVNNADGAPYGLVHFGNTTQAEGAIANMNGVMLEGLPMEVRFL